MISWGGIVQQEKLCGEAGKSLLPWKLNSADTTDGMFPKSLGFISRIHGRWKAIGGKKGGTLCRSHSSEPVRFVNAGLTSFRLPIGAKGNISRTSSPPSLWTAIHCSVYQNSCQSSSLQFNFFWYFSNAKMPLSPDKTAAIATVTLISSAAAVVYKL